MRSYALGIITGIIICMVIISYFPTPETDQACYNCGMKAWYFQLAEENK